MGVRLRLTVTKEWEVEEEHFADVEWPAGSGKRKDLATPEEIAAYQQWQLDEGDLSIEAVLDLDDEDPICKVEVVPYVQTSEPTPVGVNPFLEDDQLDKVAESVQDGLEADRAYDAGAKAEVSGAAAETDDTSATETDGVTPRFSSN